MGSEMPSGEPSQPPPRHIAIIMDGNGRWASTHDKPRHAGHRAGVRVARAMTRACVEAGVEVLTLFAFSSENWQRPAEEVNGLMRLFVEVLQREVNELHANGIQLRFIGARDQLSELLRRRIAAAEAKTAGNARMTLVLAVAYGGRWDIVQACRQALAEGIAPEAFDEAYLSSHMALSFAPDPDLFIRTGGEMRISNFVLWQAAYSELFFTECLWPDFGVREIDAALGAYAQRDRRFGGIRPPAVAQGA